MLLPAVELVLDKSMEQRGKSFSVRINRSLSAVVSWHFRVLAVILVVVLLGDPRLEGGGSSPWAFWFERLVVGESPVVFMDKRGAILVYAHRSAIRSDQSAGMVCTGVVATARAE